MHTVSGLLYPDDPTDASRSVVFSIDRQGEALVVVTAPLHDGELPMTLLITPGMPCHQYFSDASDLARGQATHTSSAAAPGPVASAGSP